MRGAADMPPLDEELDEAKAFSVKAVVVAAVVIPMLLILLHFVAAVLHIDFSPVKEAEIVITCLAVLAAIGKFAFSSKSK